MDGSSLCTLFFIIIHLTHRFTHCILSSAPSCRKPGPRLQYIQCSKKSTNTFTKIASEERCDTRPQLKLIQFHHSWPKALGRARNCFFLLVWMAGARDTENTQRHLLRKSNAQNVALTRKPPKTRDTATSILLTLTKM